MFINSGKSHLNCHSSFEILKEGRLATANVALHCYLKIIQQNQIHTVSSV